MTPPRISFNREELKLTLTGLGGGWTLQRLGEVQLFNQAHVEFPSSWSRFQMSAATQVVDATWRLNASSLVQQTLEAGITYSLRNGTSASMSANSELIHHLLTRPTVRIDAIISVKLEGSADRNGFDGSASFGVGFRGTF